jgi:hypothetical protein
MDTPRIRMGHAYGELHQYIPDFSGCANTG